MYVYKSEDHNCYNLPLAIRPEGVTTGAGTVACTIGGAAGSNKGLLGKSSNVKPVTEALNKGFLMGVAPGRCCFWESLIIFTLKIYIITYIQ